MAPHLADKIFGPADQHRRQVAQIANRLPPSGAIRLERLRGFGAPPGMLVTCGCARLDFADGSHGILVTAADAATRFMPLAERLQRLVEGIDAPVAAFARDGTADRLQRRRAIAARLSRSLRGRPRRSARRRAETRPRRAQPIGDDRLMLQRVGSGADVGLIALRNSAALLPSRPEGGDIVDEFAEQPAEPIAAAPEYEAPALSDEAPAEFALIDELRRARATVPEPAIEDPAAEAVRRAIAETSAEARSPARTFALCRSGRR